MLFPQPVPPNLSTSILSPMQPTMAKRSLVWSLLLVLEISCFIVISTYGENLPPRTISGGKYHEAISRMQAFKASLTRHDSIASTPSSISPSSSPSPLPFQVSTPFSLVFFYLGKCQMFDFFFLLCRV